MGQYALGPCSFTGRCSLETFATSIVNKILIQITFPRFPGPKITNPLTSGGAFSGGAWFHQDKLILYYTDSLKIGDELVQIQNYTTSTDFIHFDHFTTAINERPERVSQDFRDPTVVVNIITGQYQLYLGTSIDGAPSVIQYISDGPLGPWKYDGPIYQAPYLNATTIECPNVFYLVDQQTQEQSALLIYSINDLVADTSYTIYVLGKLDEQGRFRNTTDINRVDYGGHFYATQVFAGEFLDTVLAITWMQDWNKPAYYFGNQDFSCVMGLTRKMFLVKGILHQLPIDTVNSLRIGKNPIIEWQGIEDCFQIPELAEIKVVFQEDWSAKILYSNSLTEEIVITYSNNKLTVSKIQFYDYSQILVQELNSQRSYQSRPFKNIGNQIDVRVYIDRAAIEVYANNGEATFSERILGGFRDAPTLQVNGLSSLQVWQLGTFY